MKNKHSLLLLFVLLKFLLQFIAINEVYDLHRDEYLHLDLGNHLQWGYVSVPPVTAWLSYLIMELGNTVFWVKFFPALFGALTIVVAWRIVEALGGQLFALSLTAICLIFSSLLRLNILYQPNSLEFLLWTTLFYTIIKYVQSEDRKWLWYTGLFFALGFLNKYNIAFLLLGLLPAMLFSDQKKLFANAEFYKVFLFTIILISPNLWWQYQNDFPVIWHMTTLSKTQLVHVNRLDFLTEQLFFFTGALIVLFAGLVSFFTYNPFKKFRFLFWTLIIILSLYIYLRAKSYYAIGLYPVYIAFGSVYLEHVLSKGRSKILRPVLLLIPIVVFVPMFTFMLPVLSPKEIVRKSDEFSKLGLLRWEDGKEHELPQDFADMQGWSELGEIVDTAFDRLSDRSNTLIHCDEYGMAGAINFYSNKKETEALTLDADYINWYPLDDIKIEHVILVQGSWDDDPERKREKPLFEEVSLIGEVENPYARNKGTRVYLLKGAKKNINMILKEEIQNRIDSK